MAQGHEAWQVDENAFPREAPIADQLRFAIRYAILAPSGHNAQPWLFQVKKDTVALFADRTRALPVSDPDDRELTISCGSALYQLRLALRRFGYRGDTTVFPEPDDPDLLACVRPGAPGAPSEDELALFRAIPRRRTSRRAFERRVVDEPVLQALSAAASSEGAWLFIARDPERRQKLADLVAEGDRQQGGNRAFRREMAAWAHPNRARTGDGMPGYTYGVGNLEHFVGPTILRTFETLPGHAAAGREVDAGSPALAVLGTRDDAPESWLAAGQSLARVLLRARASELFASYLNQPVEIPSLRRQVREVLGLSGEPQLILRFGYGEEVPPTPRRPLEDVLI